MSATEHMPDPGFYGKLPGYGDFIRKRLPADFVSPWDDWLQAGIAAARERLPEQWLTYYLNCPAWSFVLGGGLCGEQACAGVTIPSVDRVGRYFNFTLATLLPAKTEPATFLARNQHWLRALGELALTVLGDELDQDSIERALDELPALHGAALPRLLFEQEADHVRLSGDGLEPDSDWSLASLLHQLLVAQQGNAYGIWRVAGSNQVPAQLLCSRALPGQALFLDMMMSSDAQDDAEAPMPTMATAAEPVAGGDAGDDGLDLQSPIAVDTPDNESSDEEEGDPLLDKFLSS